MAKKSKRIAPVLIPSPALPPFKKGAKPAPVPESEQARVTKAGEEGLTRGEAANLNEYSGRYIEIGSGEEFALKKVEDDPHGHQYHLKNEVHYHALNEKDFKALFEKK